MTNVLNLRCPICARADGIQIRAQTWVAITDVGNRPFPPEWEKDSQAICDGCDHSGTVEQFEAAGKQPIKPYMADFQTTYGKSEDIFHAETPEQALSLAQQSFKTENGLQVLGFTPGDCPQLQEIRIITEDADEALIWQTDEYRLQLAAPKLLEALEKQIEITKEIIDAWNNTDHLYSAVEDLISELDSKSQWAQEVLRASARCDLTDPIEHLEKSLDENLATIAQAKGGAA
jgi:hypothetical protein